ncbi:exported hypothetical protein [uncultured Desulfatiglans sp.]|uniref:Uncharacterized protein n=1 Tax=Uncultured Desulfatiglans sp. TaxID=1748965 RepID=A0A653A626_UNCDX|nr:exported hypothetical protein [uncultured Desulfatiglans sp.]
MRIFLYTLRVLSPTPAGRVPVSSHAARAQSHRFAAGPGLANIKEIERLRGGDLQVASQANVRIETGMGSKDHFRMETIWCQKRPRYGHRQKTSHVPSGFNAGLST